jgi:hypothetical protein
MRMQKRKTIWCRVDTDGEKRAANVDEAEHEVWTKK